jgi:adenylate cyclase
MKDLITENIIAGLSSDGRLLVIARNSTFAYKGKSPDIQEVARKLGAQYVVEGSVQKTEDRVRITAQLIDANTAHHIWSDRYDRDLKDIFVLQDEITMRIMRAVGMQLVDGEQYGEETLPPSGSLEVYMKVMKAVEYFERRNSEDNILARRKFEEAIALDPEYATLYSMLAITHLVDLLYQSSESPLVSLAQASKNVKKALALDDEDYVAHLALAHLYMARKQGDQAKAALERAISINPNGADAYALLGNVFTMTGKPEEAINLIEKAMRLNPIPPDYHLDFLGNAYQFSGRYEDAIEVYKKVLRRSPNFVFSHINLTAAYSALGRDEEARHQAQELL